MDFNNRTKTKTPKTKTPKTRENYHLINRPDITLTFE